MTWAATCHYCGAPMIGRACPRCSYRKPAPSLEKGHPTVFTGSLGGGGAGGAAKVPSVRFITSAIEEEPLKDSGLNFVPLQSGESLLLFVFTNNGSDPLLGVPIFSGPPTWNGIDATSGLWQSTLGQTAGSSIHVFYWNLPGTGTANISMTFDGLDPATTRMFWAVAVNTDDQDPDPGGSFHFPPNGPGDYSTPNGVTIAGTQTGVHPATTDFNNAVVFSACITEQAQSATAGAWQGGFTRVHREGSDGAPGGEITGDLAWKLFPISGTAINAQLSGFASAKWTHLSTEMFL